MDSYVNRRPVQAARIVALDPPAPVAGEPRRRLHLDDGQAFLVAAETAAAVGDHVVDCGGGHALILPAATFAEIYQPLGRGFAPWELDRFAPPGRAAEPETLP